MSDTTAWTEAEIALAQVLASTWHLLTAWAYPETPWADLAERFKYQYLVLARAALASIRTDARERAQKALDAATSLMTDGGVAEVNRLSFVLSAAYGQLCAPEVSHGTVSDVAMQIKEALDGLPPNGWVPPTGWMPRKTATLTQRYSRQVTLDAGGQSFTMTESVPLGGVTMSQLLEDPTYAVDPDEEKVDRTLQTLQGMLGDDDGD